MAARRKRAHAYHHGDLRRALLDAARAELHKVGVRELSLRSVARRAGVTHTAAYHHFADKDALLRCVAQEGFEKLDAAMHAAMADAGNDPILRLRAAGLGYLRFATADPAAHQLMFELVGRTGAQDIGAVDRDLESAGARAFQTLVDAVIAARAAAHMPGDPMPDVMLQWSAVHGLATLAQNGRLESLGMGSLDEFGKKLVDRLVAVFEAGAAR
ncbi:MAG TPA: TetR/AcrR family transcriptional regulator [Myxococcota bacterium]|jgi:AcrR family transcriptional regulator